jgi:WD40 repeat protein
MDKTIILWDVASRSLLTSLQKGHDGTVSSVAFDPTNSNALASSSWEDHAVMLWDLSPDMLQKHACAIANRNLTPSEWYQFRGDGYSRTCQSL